MSNSEQPNRELDIILIKLELEAHLHGDLREEEWEDLINDHYVDKLLDGTLTRSEVADTVRRRRQIYGQNEMSQESASRSFSKQNKEPDRLSVLARLVAEEVSKDMGVQEFRTQVLGGQCLSLQHVTNWIQEKAREDQPATWWVKDYPISSDQLVHHVIAMTTSEGNTQYKLKLHIPQPPLPQPPIPLGPDVPLSECLTFRFLFYREPDSDEIREIPTASNGVLETLRQLSKRLAEEYAWTAADAALFVLTNTAPEIKSFTSAPQPRQLAALSRIVLTIDPALSPQEVAEHYRQKRQEIMPSRHRDLSEKHLQLAFFSGTQPRLGTWQQKMLKWNIDHPDWEYKEASNFAHDCLQARRRVLRSN
jgi:hypothetical protein